MGSQGRFQKIEALWGVCCGWGDGGSHQAQPSHLGKPLWAGPACCGAVAEACRRFPPSRPCHRVWFWTAVAVAGQPCGRTPPSLCPHFRLPQESCCQSAAHSITPATPPHQTPHVSGCSEILINNPGVRIKTQNNYIYIMYICIYIHIFAAKGALAIFLHPKPCNLPCVFVEAQRTTCCWLAFAHIHILGYSMGFWREITDCWRRCSSCRCCWGWRGTKPHLQCESWSPGSPHLPSSSEQSRKFPSKLPGVWVNSQTGGVVRASEEKQKSTTFLL